MEEAIEFRNNEGQRLAGIVHSPEESVERERTGVIILQAGLKDRTGAHRLYVKIARRLCIEGFYVLRFDSHGVGDSEGDMPEGYSVDSFIRIEKGEFSKDALCSIDYFMKKTGVARVVLLGLCGGAITAAIAAGKDSRIEKLVLLDPSVTLDESSNIGKIHPSSAINGFESYAVKLFDPIKVIRFITMRTDYKELWKIVLSYLKVKCGNVWKSGKPDSLVMNRSLNRCFVEGCDAHIARQKEILFIIADKSQATWDFRNKFAKDVLCKPRYKRLCKVVTIDNANHEFAALEAQRTLVNTIVLWLNNRYKCSKTVFA